MVYLIGFWIISKHYERDCYIYLMTSDVVYDRYFMNEFNYTFSDVPILMAFCIGMTSSLGCISDLRSTLYMATRIQSYDFDLTFYGLID